MIDVSWRRYWKRMLDHGFSLRMNECHVLCALYIPVGAQITTLLWNRLSGIKHHTWWTLAWLHQFCSYITGVEEALSHWSCRSFYVAWTSLNVWKSRARGLEAHRPYCMKRNRHRKHVNAMKVWGRVETGLGHLGQLCHILSRSSRSDPVYKISRSDLDSAMNHAQ